MAGTLLNQDVGSIVPAKDAGDWKRAGRSHHVPYSSQARRLRMHTENAVEDFVGKLFYVLRIDVARKWRWKASASKYRRRCIVRSGP